MRNTDAPKIGVRLAEMTSGELRLALTVEEVAPLLGMTPWCVYQAIKQGRLPSIRFGEKRRSIRVPTEALLRVLAGEEQGSY